MKTLGIIGGMGPEATAWFYHLFTVANKVASDQEHPDAIIMSRSSTPDRTAYILGKTDISPGPVLTDAALKLEMLGADAIAMPCVTSHFFLSEVKASIRIPVFDIIEETAEALFLEGIKTAALLATKGTIQSRFWEDAFMRRGIEIITPDESAADALMQLIYSIKRREGDDLLKDFLAIATAPIYSSCERFILGCTELSLIKRDFDLDNRYSDPLAILADATLKFCTGV